MQKRSLHAMTNTAIMSVCVCVGGGGGSPPHGSINSWQLWEYILAPCQVSPNFIQRLQSWSRKCLGQSDAREAIFVLRSSRKTQSWNRTMSKTYCEEIHYPWDQTPLGWMRSVRSHDEADQPPQNLKKIILRAAPLFADRNGGQNPVLKVLSHVCEFQADPRFVSIFVEIPSVVSEKKS